MLISKIIWTAWAVSEITLSLLLRSGKKDGKRGDKHSLGLIWILIVLAIFTAVWFANHYKTYVGSFSIIHPIGLVVIVAGMILRFTAIYTLGRMFTVNVAIRADHWIKKDGLYKVIRHPAYSGSLLSFLGFGLSLNNWLSLLTTMVLVSAAFLYRIRVEEKLLTEQFGPEYLDYMKTTWRLIPWIY